MPVELLDVVLLVQDSGHGGGAGGGPSLQTELCWSVSTAHTESVTNFSLGAKIQGKVNNSLLTIKVLLL